MRTVAVGLLLLIAAAACAAAPPAPALDGRDFLSTAVSENGAPRPLVPGTQITLEFGQGRISARAGCNYMGGPYAIVGGRLILSALETTAMGCDPPRHDQDQWLAGVLTSQPAVTLDGDRLRLLVGAVAIDLLDRRVADPDRPLFGTLWTVDSVIVFDGISSVPPSVTATLLLREDGSFDVHTGCNTGGGRVVVGEGTLRFSEIGLTRMACMGPAGQMEEHFLRVIQADAVEWTIESDTLTLRAGELGLVLRAL